ncbi:MAG: hypothetical protein K9L68_03900 [Spirochaetales bacterium]|nr:hypothetical protein [Spirochaetales bacterium]MCF7937722.1 hypothetical protein [Spirochaetales bacterium]
MNSKYVFGQLGLIAMLISCATVAGDSKATGNTDVPEILEAAKYADSSHNVQPWEVRVDGAQITVEVSEDRRLPEVDPENREIMLSIGGFIEQLVQAADACGYDAQVEFLLSERTGREVARLHLRKNGKTIDRKRLNLLKMVVTDKKNLAVRIPAREDLDAVLGKRTPGEGESPLVTFFPAGSREAHWFRSEAPRAALAQAERDNVQKELVGLFHFSKKTERERGIGMTPQMMGLPKIARFFWYAFFKPETMLKDSNRKAIGSITEKQLDHSAGILVISSDSGEPRDLIETGRRYQRMKIAAFKRNIVIHPISQVLEEEPWKNRVAAELGVAGTVQYIARIGYRLDSTPEPDVDAVSSPSIRMRPEQFVSLEG